MVAALLLAGVGEAIHEVDPHYPRRPGGPPWWVAEGLVILIVMARSR